MATTEQPQVEPEPAPSTEVEARLGVNPEVLATTFGEYLRGVWARVRAGESGALPVVAGLVLISVIFQSLNSHFLTAGNLVNLLVQGSVYMLLAMGEVYALLLGEIDLSLGYLGGVGAVVTAELLRQSVGWPWWSAVVAGLAICTVLGLLQGTLITRIGLPSFVVTLAGQLGWLALMLALLGSGGVIPVTSKVINGITSSYLSPTLTWVVALALVAVFGGWTWLRDGRRRRSGLTAPPASVTALKVVATLLAAVVVVLLCNADRGVLVPIRGMPWVLLLVLAVLTAWTTLLNRTRYGRYVYAIGGNAEAARRAGINLARIRTVAFGLAGFTAGLAALVYASRLRSVSTSFDGSTLVLYAIASAVIGGTSLFGGRGKAFHAVLGGLVIAAIDNGMGLQGYSAPAQYAVTALVLVVAVTIDAVSHRGRAKT